MLKKIIIFLGIVFYSLSSTSFSKEKFEIEFTNWDLGKCPGRTHKVPNPNIKINNSPDGTKILKFRVSDLDRPMINHGGGKIEYNGENIIKSGTFNYFRPCPPFPEIHTYKWTVTAYDKDNKKLGTTSFKKKYPEKK